MCKSQKTSEEDDRVACDQYSVCRVPGRARLGANYTTHSKPWSHGQARPLLDNLKNITRGSRADWSLCNRADEVLQWFHTLPQAVKVSSGIKGLSSTQHQGKEKLLWG